jgi:hypothetical protein
MMKLEELFESDNQVLMELWDNPYPWHVSQFRNNEYFFEAPYKDKNGKHVVKYMAIAFTQTNSILERIDWTEVGEPRPKKYFPTKYIVFGTVNKDDDKNPVPAQDYMSFGAMSDSNGNFRMFTTLSKICESYFNNNPSDVIKFSGDGASRVKLYARLSRVMAARLGMTVYIDTVISHVKTMNDNADFVLLNNKLAKVYRPSDTRYRLL